MTKIFFLLVVSMVGGLLARSIVAAASGSLVTGASGVAILGVNHD